jgi:hypothetical protein
MEDDEVSPYVDPIIQVAREVLPHHGGEDVSLFHVVTKD